jgi:resolvase
MIFGYARVSTAEQKLETQIELLKQQGCEKIYTDIASGVREDRKGLNEMLSFLREGDVVIVYKTDRIFRSLKNMIELIEFFNQKGVFFKSISNPLLIRLLPMENLSFRFLEQWLSLKEISSVKERKQESKGQGEERNSSEDPKE